MEERIGRGRRVEGERRSREMRRRSMEERRSRPKKLAERRRRRGKASGKTAHQMVQKKIRVKLQTAARMIFLSLVTAAQALIVAAEAVMGRN
jgi:hypothetical protein